MLKVGLLHGCSVVVVTETYRSAECAIQRLQTPRTSRLETPAGSTKYIIAVADRDREGLEQLNLASPKGKPLGPEAL